MLGQTETETVSDAAQKMLRAALRAFASGIASMGGGSAMHQATASYAAWQTGSGASDACRRQEEARG